VANKSTALSSSHITSLRLCRRSLTRIGVLKRKVSGGSVSAEGANAYAVLLTIYVTCNLRGISFPKYMKESLKHYIRTGKPMLLKTYSTFIADSTEKELAA